MHHNFYPGYGVNPHYNSGAILIAPVPLVLVAAKQLKRLHEMQLGIFPAAGTPFQAAAFSFSASST
jgi:hypothetical protein